VICVKHEITHTVHVQDDWKGIAENVKHVSIGLTSVIIISAMSSLKLEINLIVFKIQFKPHRKRTASPLQRPTIYYIWGEYFSWFSEIYTIPINSLCRRSL
jgi:hypothetical protein